MQLAQGMPHHVALEAFGGETGGLGRAVHGGDGTQGQPKCIRVVGLECCEAAAGKTEAGKDRLRQRDRLGEAGHIVARLGTNEEAHRRRAIRNSGRDRFQADLRDLVDLHRQNIGRQAVAVPRERVDQCAAVLGVVKHHHRLLAASFAVGAEQRSQFTQQRIGRRKCVGCGAGRAGGGALAAAGADCRVNRHMIAVGRNGAGRTEIEAAAAADDLGARMRA